MSVESDEPQFELVVGDNTKPLQPEAESAQPDKREEED